MTAAFHSRDSSLLARRARLLRALTAALQFAARISLAPAAAPATFLGAS